MAGSKNEFVGIINGEKVFRRVSAAELRRRAIQQKKELEEGPPLFPEGWEQGVGGVAPAGGRRFENNSGVFPVVWIDKVASGDEAKEDRKDKK